MRRNDCLLAVGCLLAAAAAWLFFHFCMPGDHLLVRITVDGEIYGEYPLEEDQEIAIGSTNVCRIADGKVKMIRADCPDQICVHQKAADAAGGSIICLPNRVVIETVKETGEPVHENVDAVA